MVVLPPRRYRQPDAELSNMEDIIPIFIVVLLLAEVPEVKAQLDMIVDFIEFDTCDLESERRLLLNLSVRLPPRRSPSTSSTATGRCDRP